MCMVSIGVLQISCPQGKANIFTVYQLPVAYIFLLDNQSAKHCTACNHADNALPLAHIPLELQLSILEQLSDGSHSLQERGRGGHGRSQLPPATHLYHSACHGYDVDGHAVLK